MADEKSEQPDVLEKVARTVGSALGTVVSAAEDLTKAKGNQAEGSSPRNSARQKSIASAAQKAHDKTKAKRDKHRRKLRQKTRG